MTKYYKKLINDKLEEIGFAEEIPDGTIEITSEEHAELHALIEQLWIEFINELERQANLNERS